jgi:hypothetical protein
MSKLNWQIVKSNLAEAREQLQELEERIKAGKPPGEIELEIMLRHAYHHLNVAWNARRKSTKQYSSLSEDDFKEWGRFPLGFDSTDT